MIPSGKIHVSIVGGSGYAGGELLRLLLGHPETEIRQVSAGRSAGSFVHFTHPNLRGLCSLRFVANDELEPCDLLFLALPHGKAMERIDHWCSIASRLVDLSADFRLDDADDFKRWYKREHSAPERLEQFVYGLPELQREALRGANLTSGVGCNATASLLGLLPLADTDLVNWRRGVIIDLKVGSSESGHRSSDASHHPERSGAVRSFAPTGHRHTAEVLCGLRKFGIDTEVHLSATAIEMVRGVLATTQLFLRPGVVERDLYRAFRAFCSKEPFVRLVKERRGLYRFPEPKILAGSNHVEIGFEYDSETQRLVVISALDNLVKGAAGSAVQSMNLMCGFEETAGLGFPGLHPV